jgi:hypothetical protein
LLTPTTKKKEKEKGVKTPSLLHNRKHGDGNACTLLLYKQAHIKTRGRGGELINGGEQSSFAC